MPDAPKYSDDEVRQIIERAVKNDGSGTPTISHGDLLSIGEQVGLSPEDMTRAAHEVSEARLDSAATKALKSRRRKWLAAHAALFAVVNGLLFTVNFLTTPGEWWVLFSVFFWGLALTLHAGLALGIGVSQAAVHRERRKLEARKAASSSARLRVAEVSLPRPDHERAELEEASHDGRKEEAEGLSKN